MNLNLREAILDNIADNNQEQLEATIIEAINRNEEKMLPGLGVLFELIWKESSPEIKTEMLNNLEQGIKHETHP